MGRRQIEIDIQLVESLAKAGLTQREVCQYLNISEDTLQRRKRDFADFAAIFAKVRLGGMVDAKSQLWQAVKEGRLWAIKAYLIRAGWKPGSSVEVTGPDNMHLLPRTYEIKFTDSHGKRACDEAAIDEGEV